MENSSSSIQPIVVGLLCICQRERCCVETETEHLIPDLEWLAACLLTACSFKCETEASASPESVLEIQNLRPRTQDLPNPNLDLNKIPGRFVRAVRFAKSWPQRFQM